MSSLSLLIQSALPDLSSHCCGSAPPPAYSHFIKRPPSMSSDSYSFVLARLLIQTPSKTRLLIRIDFPPSSLLMQRALPDPPSGTCRYHPPALRSRVTLRSHSCRVPFSSLLIQSVVRTFSYLFRFPTSSLMIQIVPQTVS